MEQIIHNIRILSSVYKRNSDKAELLFKFFAGIIVFGWISRLSLGNVHMVKVIGITFLCGLISMLVSSGTFLFFAAVVSCFYISFVSVEAAALFFLVYFLILVFYVRIFPKESIIILLMIGAYAFKIPYVVPLAAGIYVGIKGLGAVIIGVFLYHNIGVIKEIAETLEKTDFTIAAFVDNGVKMLDVVVKNIDISWVFPAGVFSLGLISVWIISNTFIDNETNYGILVSGVLMIIGFLLCGFLTSAKVSIAGALIGIPVSCIIVFFIQKIDFVLDYPNAERVKFQDDNYVYYVKAVPKIKQ